jgi:hypothetical protein
MMKNPGIIYLIFSHVLIGFLSFSAKTVCDEIINPSPQKLNSPPKIAYNSNN